MEIFPAVVIFGDYSQAIIHYSRFDSNFEIIKIIPASMLFLIGVRKDIG